MSLPNPWLVACCALALSPLAFAQDAPPSAAPASAAQAAPPSKSAAPPSAVKAAPKTDDPEAPPAKAAPGSTPKAAPATDDPAAPPAETPRGAPATDDPTAPPADGDAAAPPADDEAVAEGDDALDFDAVDVPAPKPLPPMPKDTDDFSSDKGLFGVEVRTEPERVLGAELAAQDARARLYVPLHERMPGFAYGAEAAAGLFGAGIIGLVGGAIGNAISDGDPLQPLGGAKSGRPYGILGGGLTGAALGVWGGAVLFDKDTAPGWSILGSGLGSIVGGGAATGILIGVDDRNTASTLAVGTLFICQVVGALIFADVGME